MAKKNKKFSKEENGCKQKALIYMFGPDEKRETELRDYVERYGYQVVDVLICKKYREGLNSVIALEDILKSYHENDFDTVIVSNLYQISDNEESLSALCVLLSDYNITLESMDWNEGRYGTNFIFNIKRDDHIINRGSCEERALILLNDVKDKQINITSKKLQKHAFDNNYKITNIIKLNLEQYLETPTLEIVELIMKEREKCFFDTLIILNSWQLADYNDVFASLCVLLAEEEIKVQTLYKGSYGSNFYFDTKKKTYS